MKAKTSAAVDYVNCASAASVSSKERMEAASSANCAATYPKAQRCTRLTFLCEGVKPSACTPLLDHWMLHLKNGPIKRDAIVMGGRREHKEHWRGGSNTPFRCQT